MHKTVVNEGMELKIIKELSDGGAIKECFVEPDLDGGSGYSMRFPHSKISPEIAAARRGRSGCLPPPPNIAILITMKAHNHAIIRRKVNHAVGSMAIEGIVVSRKTKADMLRIASGKTSATEVKQKLIAQYRQA